MRRAIGYQGYTGLPDQLMLHELADTAMIFSCPTKR
jgi:hypothetical protein